MILKVKESIFDIVWGTDQGSRETLYPLTKQLRFWYYIRVLASTTLKRLRKWSPSNHIDNIISVVCLLLWHQSLSARDVKTCVFKFQILVTNIGIGGMGGWSIISCLQVNWTGMRFMSVTLCESERARGGRACSHDVTVSTFGCHERDNSICCCILRFIDLDNKTPHSKRIHKKSLLPPVVKRESQDNRKFSCVLYREQETSHFHRLLTFVLDLLIS